MEKVLEEDGFNARALTWEQLGYEVGLDVSGRTVQRHRDTMDYHIYLAGRKGWCNERIKAKRVECCEIWKEKYHNKEDWHHVRFSDEFHYGFGPQTRYVSYASLVKDNAKIAGKKAILKAKGIKKGNKNDSLCGLVPVGISNPI